MRQNDLKGGNFEYNAYEDRFVIRPEKANQTNLNPNLVNYYEMRGGIARFACECPLNYSGRIPQVRIGGRPHLAERYPPRIVFPEEILRADGGGNWGEKAGDKSAKCGPPDRVVRFGGYHRSKMSIRFDDVEAEDFRRVSTEAVDRSSKF